MSEEKKEFFSLVAYIKGRKKKVGYALQNQGRRDCHQSR